MSGIDERRGIKLETQESLARVCPACRAAVHISFKTSSNHIVGALRWNHYANEIYASLYDWRTTYRSIKRHRAICGCGHVLQKDSWEYKSSLETFRSKITLPSWIATYERNRQENSLKTLQ